MNTLGRGKNDITNSTNATVYSQAALQCVQVLIDCVPSLQDCILNVDVDGNTLVVVCSDKNKLSFVKQNLQPHWLGDIKVYYSGDFTVGA